MSEPAAPTPGPLVETEALAIRYGRTRVLEGVSLSVPKGCVYALLGRNGSGKSSLLRVLLGERPASASGTVRLLGEDPWHSRARLMDHVGVVPEEPNAPPEMYGATAVRLLRPPLPALGRGASSTGASEPLRRADRPTVRRPVEGPEGRRDALARSRPPPRLLLLDDPTLGLDVVVRDAVFREVIGELADHGTTVLRHDARPARRSRASPTGSAILHEGRLALDGSLEALKTQRGESLEQMFASVAGTRATDAHAAEARP